MGEEKVVFENQCEPYTEKTCWTQNEEDCKPIMYKNCTGVIQTKVDRVCFNVNELVCSLVENIYYETLEETYQVQRCFTGKDRVCDTTYKIDMTTRMITSAPMSRHPIATWRRKSSTMSHALTPENLIVRGISQPRTTGMGQRELSVIGSQLKIATTFLARSKSKCAKLMFTGTVRNSQTSSPSPWKSKTVILSQRKFVSLK